MNEYAPNRRSYLRSTLTEDQWALANEDDLSDTGVEIEDLAAGYVDDEPLPLAPSSRVAYRARLPRRSRYEPNGQGRIPAPLHEQRHWEVEPWNEQLETQHSPRRVASQPRRAVQKSQVGSNIPLWAILLLVVLGLTAVLVTVLAFVMVLSLL
ncbi:MAG TPA: hypothetical protein PKD09_19795 [Aggregatilinea sp.]|uniref:hypothetical protein n=1 Tax=Aggregatilinea sp. TaxID=2806333 RepID=UPI002D1BA33B|nr:hypothetical protein [Aggregatilinea sp.]HML23909.1 hypothetical protein [Aggregatilinea sp.]